MQDIHFGAATRTDLSAIGALLTDCHLPTDDIERITDNCLVARLGSKIVGTVAQEPCCDRHRTLQLKLASGRGRHILQ